MKIIVYVVVFCLLFFLLVLSFDEGKNTAASSEWNQVAAELENVISDNNHTQSGSSARMNEINQITQAQEQGITGLSLAETSFTFILDNFQQKISDLMTFFLLKTKEAAYTLSYDISELLYPTKKSTKEPSGSIISSKQTHAMQSQPQRKQEQTSPIQKDKTIPVPETMAGK